MNHLSAVWANKPHTVVGVVHLAQDGLLGLSGALQARTHTDKLDQPIDHREGVGSRKIGVEEDQIAWCCTHDAIEFGYADTTAAKRRAGEWAADLVQDGTLVGLGTGSTVYWTLRRLGERIREGLQIRGIPSSRQTEALAISQGIPLISFADVDELDLTIDGADAIDPELNLMKEALVFNRKAFQSRGVVLPPSSWSWEQLVTAARVLTTAIPGGTSGRWGFNILPGLPGLWTMAWQRGAQIVSDDGAQIYLNEPGTIAAMAFLADLIFNAKFAPHRDTASLRDVSQLSIDEQRALNVGKVAMASAFSGANVWWRGGGGGDIALAELPAAERKLWVGYATMLSIPANAPDPKHSLNGLRALLDASTSGTIYQLG
jgi:hypothetical protein